MARHTSNYLTESECGSYLERETERREREREEERASEKEKKRNAIVRETNLILSHIKQKNDIEIRYKER